MKKKLMALVLVAVMAISAMSIFTVQAANSLDVTVDGSNVKFTVTGEYGSTDWVGVYCEGEKYGSGDGTVTSVIWWYLNKDSESLVWPADVDTAKAANDAIDPQYGPINRREMFVSEDDFSLKPGKYYAAVFANGGYELVEGYEIVNFEVKATDSSDNNKPDAVYTEEETEFQTSIDLINDVLTGGGHGGTQFYVKGDFTFEDKTSVNGWVATEAGIAKYQSSTDGKTWKDCAAEITARADLAGANIPYENGHSTAGFVATVEGTKDCTTLYFRAITKDNKVVNFFALTTGDAADVAAPEIGTVTGTPKPVDPAPTGDVSYLVVAVAMAALIATVVLKKKRAEA